MVLYQKSFNDIYIGAVIQHKDKTKQLLKIKVINPDSVCLCCNANVCTFILFNMPFKTKCRTRRIIGITFKACAVIDNV